MDREIRKELPVEKKQCLLCNHSYYEGYLLVNGRAKKANFKCLLENCNFETENTLIKGVGE